jgi:hypothetical protein
MPRILKNIRIDEVSACTKGAGVGTKIVLMKRDTSADDFDDWHREQAAEAERQNEEHLRKHAPTWRSFNEVFAENVAKSYAATARGDEADRHDEDAPVDGLVDGDGDSVADGGNDHAASKIADLLVESGKHPDRRAALDHLLHTARGAAMLRRLRKQQEDFTAMSTTPEQKLSDIVKRVGITALAKAIVDEDSAFSIDEHQLTALTIEAAKRDNPDLSDAQAFAKVFTAQDEGGVILRKAFHVVKTAGAAPYFDLKPMFVSGEDALDVDDPAKAIAQLTAIGRQKWPTAPEAEAFERAFTDPANAKLAAKAHRRPAPTTSYPWPR